MPISTNEERIRSEVAKLFEEGSVEHTEVILRFSDYKGHPAVFVKVGKMYERPRYIGEGGIIGMLTGLQNACGGNRIDEYGSESNSGCETCDYGSFYADEFVVWEEQAH